MTKREKILFITHIILIILWLGIIVFNIATKGHLYLWGLWCGFMGYFVVIISYDFFKKL